MCTPYYYGGDSAASHISRAIASDSSAEIVCGFAATI